MRISELAVAEDRITDAEYEDSDSKVIARLKSYNSQSYTKLAQKVERISALEAEIKQLKEEVKQETRDNVAGLFDAEDAVKTRVVETLQFILQLTKDPEPSVTPKYKEILEALTESLTPELIQVLTHLKATMVTVTQKQPSLKVRKIGEGVIGDFFADLKAKLLSWANRYDAKLAQLQAQL